MAEPVLLQSMERFCSADALSNYTKLLAAQWKKQNGKDRFRIPLELEDSNRPFSALLCSNAEGFPEFVSKLGQYLKDQLLSDADIMYLLDDLVLARDPSRTIQRWRAAKQKAIKAFNITIEQVDHILSQGKQKEENTQAVSIY